METTKEELQSRYDMVCNELSMCIEQKEYLHKELENHPIPISARADVVEVNHRPPVKKALSETVKKGTLAKFQVLCNGELLWVLPIKQDDSHFYGIIFNDPVAQDLKAGDLIEFTDCDVFKGEANNE